MSSLAPHVHASRVVLATAKLRVLVAEDSLLVREGIQRLLEAQPDFELVGVCSDLDALLTAVDALTPDVVLADIRMPPTSTDEGIRAARALRETHPAVAVLVLSQHDEAEYAVRLLEPGARGRGYLLKDHVLESDQLASAIRQVAAGGSVVDPQIVDELLRARLRSKSSPFVALTARERDVLSAMAEGGNNEAIASGLYMSVGVVEKHINSIFSKLALGEERDINKRVKAVLLFLSESQ